MELRYLRHRTYERLAKPFSDRRRRKRMQEFARRLRLQPGMSVIDIGGQPAIWRDVGVPLDVVILNLPGAVKVVEQSHHRFSYVEGDACAVDHAPDKSYDLAFSNSVIEHVGNDAKQQAFAHEVRRLGRSYWVQTPAIWFPLEPHTGMPFWWFYPESLRQYFFRSWRPKLPAWTQSMEETRVLTRRRLQSLFPEATINVEWCLGIPKSYTAWYVGS